MTRPLDKDLDPTVKDVDIQSAESRESGEESSFDMGLIKNYPFSESKVSLRVSSYGYFREENSTRAHSLYISPHGIEFTTSKEFDVGTLVKINVAIPDYWGRKQEFVDYGRIDKPKVFKVIARVIKVDQATRNKKKNVVVETLNIDEVDAKVLQRYLMEKKKTPFIDEDE